MLVFATPFLFKSATYDRKKMNLSNAYVLIVSNVPMVYHVKYDGLPFPNLMISLFFKRTYEVF